MRGNTAGVSFRRPVGGWCEVGINHLVLRVPEDSAYDLVIAVAEGRVGCPEVATQLASWVPEPASLGS